MGPVGRFARVSFGLSAVLCLSCRPGASSFDPAVAGDPGPPEAPVIAIVTPYGSTTDDRTAAAAAAGLRVEEFGPQGAGWDGGSIAVRFNHPMKQDAMPRYTFDPPVSGSTRWIGPFVATFVPENKDVQVAHAYAVKVDGTVESVDGDRKTLGLSWTLETARPLVEMIEPYDRRGKTQVHWKTTFEIHLTHQAKRANLLAALRVTARPKTDKAATPVAVPFRLVREDHEYNYGMGDWRVEPRGRWPLGSEIVAEVDGSLVTKAGPLSVQEGAVARFTTTDGVTAKVECEDPFPGGCGPSSLRLSFDRAVLRRELRKVTVSPRPAKLKVAPPWDDEDGNTEAHIEGEFVVGEHYEVRISGALRDTMGQPLTGERVFEFDIVPPGPSLEFSSKEGILPATQPPRIGLETRYLADTRLVIANLTDAQLALLVATEASKRRMPRGAKPTRRQLTLKPGGKYAWTSNVFDLGKEIGGTFGAVFFAAHPGDLLPSAKGKPTPDAQRSLFQVTDLGALAGTSPAMSFVRVSRLSTGRPVQGAHVTVYAVAKGKAKKRKRYGPSGKDGIVRLPPENKLGKDAVGVVELDDDRFGLRLAGDAPETYSWGRPKERGKEFVVSSVVTDRPLYKAGESVRVMGWAVKSTPKTASGLRPIGRPMVDLELVDPRDRVVAKSRVRVKPYGKYWAKLDLPEEAKLGRYRARATFGDETFDFSFKVRDFRTPAFDVVAAVASGDLLRGTTAHVTVNASYLHGMSVPIAKNRNRGRCFLRSFTPATHAEWLPAVVKNERRDFTTSPSALNLDAAKTGHLEFDVSTSGLPKGGAYGCSVAVAVQDAAREEMGADVSYNVHPSRYLLMSPTPWSVKGGEAVDVEVQATDFAGTRVSGGDVELRLVRVWRADGKTKKKRADSCKRRVGAAGTTTCRLTAKKEGRYQIQLHGKADGADVVAQRGLRVWKPYKSPPAMPKSEKPRFFRLTLDDPKADVGERVQMTFVNPERSASGVVARMHGGLRGFERFEIRDHAGSLSLPVKDAWIPSMRFFAFVTTPGSDVELPEIHSAEAAVQVGSESRRLQVGVAAPESVGPGDGVSIAVDVRDTEGLAAASHVTIWAVDEAILALEDFRFPDFVRDFAIDRGSESRFRNDFRLMRRPYTKQVDPWEFGFGGGIGLGSIGSGGGGGSGAGSGRARAPSVRRKFEATPIFIADAYTGADGKVTVKGTMPDNLTTFRIVAIASARLPDAKAIGRFGRADTRTRVTTDLAVRPVLPRVMRPGDLAEVAALVDNIAGREGSLTVELLLADDDGVARLIGKSKKRVAAAGQVRVPFDLEALAPGVVKVLVKVRLQPKGGGDPLRDAMEVQLPIKLERTMLRRAAHYGSLSKQEAVAVKVQPPEHAAKGSKQVDVSMHTSLLGGYKDNVDAMVEYPYGCIEQTSTRLIPLLALADLGKTYPLGIEDAEKYVRTAVAKIEGMQTKDGGFSYWPGGQPHLYATAYATWVLRQAQSAGHKLPPNMLERAGSYLAGELATWAAERPTSAHDDVRMAMAAQAIAATKHDASAGIDRLVERAKVLPVFAQALVLMAVHEAKPDDPRADGLLAMIIKHVEEREAFARTRAPSTRFTQYFDSPVRTDAIVLLALTKVAPEHALVEKFARGLSHARDAGQLRNTQENAYAVLAMAAYARLREAETPDLFARAWVGPQLTSESEFAGRTFDVAQGSKVIAENTKVTLAKAGTGRLYFRVGMEWVPAKPPQKPVAQGLSVERELEGNGTFRAGDLANMEVVVSAATQQDYVVIEVPLPAGLEAVDTSIGHGSAARTNHGARSWGVSHQELRGDRVLFFVDHLSRGSHTFAIPLRATTPGTYQMPPARAESMYYPEIFGYTTGETVHIVN